MFELQTALQEIERVGKNKYVMVESYRNELEQFNMQCWALTCEAIFRHRRLDLAVLPFRLHRRLRVHLLRVTDASMQVKTVKAAVLARSREPLIVDEIMFPDALQAGQVLVKIYYTSICGAQINEIEAVKGPDKFLPHLLGHEASGIVIETGPGVTHVKPGDTVVLHWRPSQGIQSATPAYSWRGDKLNAGWVTTFNDHAVVSENRMTIIPADFDLKVAPLFGCAVTTAAGVINNDAHVKIGESVVVFGIGGVGLNLVQFAHLVGANPIVAVDLIDGKLEMARSRGATHCLNSGKLGDVAGEIRKDRRTERPRQGAGDDRGQVGDRARL